MKAKINFFWVNSGIVYLTERICCCGCYDVDDHTADGGLFIDVHPGWYEVWVKYLREDWGDHGVSEFIAAVRLVHQKKMEDWRLYPKKGINIGGFCYSNAHFPVEIGSEYTPQASIMIFNDGDEPDIFFEDINEFRYEAGQDGRLQHKGGAMKKFVLKDRTLYFKSAFGDGDVMFYGVKDEQHFCAIEAVSVDETEYLEANT